MYRHLLVPLDATRLAADVVRQSIDLARALGARITFMSADPDYSSTSVAALERMMWPSLREASGGADARAVLARAAVQAREAGIEFDTLPVRSDRPYEAILQAAERQRCDLIVMASHGRRGLKGLVAGSQTRNVLQQSGLPVLVLAAGAGVADWERIEALAILRDEHRSLAAVAHGLELLAREAQANGAPPSFDLLRAIVHYIREFPEKLHHPKEDAWLFRRLRERTAEFNETLDELERQHRSGRTRVDELEANIERYAANPAGGYASFAAAVGRFVAEQQSHMRLETQVILPAAVEHLTSEDWDEIGRAFAENGDPRFNAETDEEFREMFVRILNLVPPAGTSDAASRG